jgi:hypothetical protein
VVVDDEQDHVHDEAYMASVASENDRIRATLAEMPNTTEQQKVAYLNIASGIRTSATVTQHRIYFDEAGSRIYETVRPNLERARAIDFAGVATLPPNLYDDHHPANVHGQPSLEGLFPTPRYGWKDLPESEVSETDSIAPELVAKAPFDAEASLSAEPSCR